MNKAKVEIYTRKFCGYCSHALRLLDEKSVTYTQYKADEHENLKETMIERTGGRTFPQIVINDKPIGGCDDLCELDNSGELDTLLANDRGNENG